MSKYIFDGSTMRINGSRIAELQGDTIRDAHASLLGQFDSHTVRDGHSQIVATFDGTTIRDSHAKKIGTMNDVHKAIDGVGGMSLVALWVLVVR